MRHIVFFSSGIGSWAAARRVADKYGTDNMILLFADTGIEDPDNYRFLHDAAQNIGAPLVIVRNKKDATVFDNWKSNSAIANNRMPFCSYQMKHKPCRDWLKEHAQDDDVFVVGIGWDEVHRLEAIQKGWMPNKVIAPMTESPYLDKPQVLAMALADGLQPPQLYSYGLPHANCGGGCVRAGIGQWRHVYKVLPDVFARWEMEEQRMRDRLGKDVAILKRSTRGVVSPFPLSELRKEIENDGQLDLLDWGGCGCFVDQEDEQS